MSFILDALRKSEAERRRDTVPEIAHIPLAPARLAAPRWVVPVTAALALTVVGVSAAWWLSAGDAPAPPAAAEPALAARKTASAASDAAATAQAPAGVPRTAEPATGTAGPGATRGGAPSEPEPAPPARRREVVPLREVASRPSRAVAGGGATPPPSGASDAVVAAALPRFSDLLAEGLALPALELELHVYSETPGRRFVFINGGRYGEGDTLDTGQSVVRVTPGGVVLSHSGRRFLLLPE